jgi:hypothetical protein
MATDKLPCGIGLMPWDSVEFTEHCLACPVCFKVFDAALGLSRLKTHYIHGCHLARYADVIHAINVGPVVSDIAKVTCKACIKIIKKRNLKPRDAFPEIPTFDVTAEGWWQNPGSPPGCHLTFTCPVCGEKIVHGGYFDNPGAADGHRVSHCGCWEEGYYIREVKEP